MTTKRIERMDKWLILKQALKEKGYMLWQTQYDWDLPDGFAAGFMKEKERLEVVTHSKEIENDIINSNL